MIFQGLFNILELYSTQEEFFYDKIDRYFQDKISNIFEESIKKNNDLSKKLKESVSILEKEFIKLGFKPNEFENKTSNHFLIINKNEKKEIITIIDLYKKKIAPLVYEIFLEKIFHYLADIDTGAIMLYLKSEGLLPIEFILELRNLKNSYDQNPKKKENLRKYIQIQENIIQKFSENKNKIESLEDLDSPRDKLQLIYLIYRIIDFVYMQRIFDFSHIKNYIKNNVDEWLESIPLVNLKNPDQYFCGIYLAKRFGIKLDKKKVHEFLLNLYEEIIDEFEAPLIEATDQVYYYFKSTELIKLWLTEEQLKPITIIDSKFFEPSYLKNLETSQLVIILKIYHLLNLYEKIEIQKIKSIFDELDTRISPEGVKQYRDGFFSSESTYYVIFSNYMANSLDKLKEFDLLESIVSRIYRNLELCNFSQQTNYDLLSEIFYSCESLKLFNCIETKQMIIHLANYLLPQEIVNKISKIEDFSAVTTARFRHLKVNRFTGETIY
ncbi:MAG: hypothetical protein ACFFHV_00695 [Promethearchaeota archaeon]